MNNWADQLIHEYSEGRKQLAKLKEKSIDTDDIKQINSMIHSMSYSIDWMTTGRQPGTYRGVDKRAIYQRQYISSMEVIPDITEQIDINQKQLYMTREEKIILADILSSLSHRERYCYIMHVTQKMSMSKIGEEIGVSKATVQSYIKRAKTKVKERAS